MALNRKQDSVLFCCLCQFLQAVDKALHHIWTSVLRMWIPRTVAVEASRPYVQDTGIDAAGYQTHSLHGLDARLPFATFRMDQVRVDSRHFERVRRNPLPSLT